MRGKVVKALEVIKRLFLLPWAFLRPSQLPYCPRCGRELGALDEHHERVCEQRCETCWFYGCYMGVCDGWAQCMYQGAPTKQYSWCPDWAPRNTINWQDNLVADNKRLRDALQRIGTGGYGPDAGKAISAIVSAALLDEKTS